LAGLGPVFDKALAKSPRDRYDKCIDFARALAHHIGADEQNLSADATKLAIPATGPRHARQQTQSRRRLIIGVAATLAVIAIAAVGFVAIDRTRDHSAAAKTPPSPTSSAPAAPGNVTLPVVVVGAKCATLGAAGITEGGAPAYCAHLPTTNGTIWSLYPGEISSPTATAGANDEVYPSETEAPVLVCMEQTGQTHLDCHDDILQSNGTATSTPPS
jgi:serine/threonine-protein kinase